MAPTKMERALSTHRQQQNKITSITTSISISTSDSILFDNIQYDEKTYNGESGITTGHLMGRRSVTDAVTIALLRC